ncbi:MAG: serine/threonine protein kinase [Planctomycetes bacterium]|nr:serine/threonine protein kinase [Planctomycetota bacterium]
MPDNPLGQLAVEQGWITAEQRDEALRLQADLRKSGLFMRVGELLSRRAFLQTGQVRELLQRQGIALVRCAACGKQFNARNWSAGRGTCACGGALDPAPAEAPLSVAGNAAMAALGDAAPGKAAPPPGALRGRYFGKYPLLEELGRGAMGLVYKAWDPALGRPVAVKVLIDAGNPDESAKRRHQFLQEVRSAARLRHSSIVSVHEVGQSDGQGFFTMDFIDGAPLSALVREEEGAPPLAFEKSEKPLPHVIEWIRDVALALQHAHQNGLLHCDVKPGNILIDRRNKALLSDFSAARSLRLDLSDPNTKRVLGTLFYMSPEQARGVAQEVGPAADIWGAGAVLYLLLTGKRPFSGENPVEVRKSIAVRPCPSPRSLNAKIPKALEAIVVKCLQKEPAARYGSAKELADDLQRFLDGQPVQAPVLKEAGSAPFWHDRRAWIAIAAGVLLLAGMLLVKFVMSKGTERKGMYELPEETR